MFWFTRKPPSGSQSALSYNYTLGSCGYIDGRTGVVSVMAA